MTHRTHDELGGPLLLCPDSLLYFVLSLTHSHRYQRRAAQERASNEGQDARRRRAYTPRVGLPGQNALVGEKTTPPSTSTNFHPIQPYKCEQKQHPTPVRATSSLSNFFCLTPQNQAITGWQSQLRHNSVSTGITNFYKCKGSNSAAF